MENTKKPWDKFVEMSAGKQIGIIATTAIAIVAIIALLLWGTSANYRVLYSGLDGADTTAIMDQLSKKGVPYKLNESTGAILVGGDKVYEMRLEMSSLGIPKKTDNMDFFDSGQRMGLSKSMEKARLKKMMELELSRSIMEINAVKSARVHIAMPPNSVFTRERGEVTASVIVGVGDNLTKKQVKSIISLVSRSIPRLSASNVTVVDTNGKEWSKGDGDKGAEGEEFKDKIERHMEDSINDIIGNIVGEQNVNSKISVHMSFSEQETTSEIYSPNSGQLRSEEWQESVENDKDGDSGKVPGALTNQPMTTDVVASDAKKAGPELVKKKDGSYMKNYELDKTITHHKKTDPEIKRITVAVIINVAKEKDQDGKIVDKIRSEAEIKQYTDIVKNTVGYNKKRGDSVVVISRKFESNEGADSVDDGHKVQWYEMDIVLQGGKWGTVLISLLIIIFMVVKPIIEGIFRKEEEEVLTAEEEEERVKGESELIAEGEQQFENEVQEVKNLAEGDPELVAQVVKQWIQSEGDGDE